MRARNLFLGLGLLLALTLPATAQQFKSSIGQSSSASFFSSPLSKLSFTSMSVKQSMPTFPNLTNSTLLRNIFTRPQTSVHLPMPKTQAPPPPPKKK